MKFRFKSILLTVFALVAISFAANADPSGYEHGNMGSSWMMEGHGYSSTGFGHGMGHEGYGQQDWMMTPHNGAIHFLQMKDLLGLNEKQITELKALRDSYRDENTIPEAKLKAAEESLKEIMEEDSINLEKAEGKIKEIGSFESGLWLSYVKQLAKIKTIITKEQLKKMWEMKTGGDGGHPGMK
jgi:Spy/CpxP family protein refolding chaperone